MIGNTRLITGSLRRNDVVHKEHRHVAILMFCLIAFLLAFEPASAICESGLASHLKQKTNQTSNNHSLFPKYLGNVWATTVVLGIGLKLETPWYVALPALALTSSASAVLLYKNHNEMAPFLKTTAIASTEITLATLLALTIGELEGAVIFLTNAIIILPLTTTLVNHRIAKTKGINVGRLNIGMPSLTALLYERNIIPGVRIVVSW